ncbi:MAG: hypothetical protein EBX37_15660, partial [Alphaproteobacteria bacterium]|nr:hypothetical protein [Alphaproteobacteria bacterium]
MKFSGAGPRKLAEAALRTGLGAALLLALLAKAWIDYDDTWDTWWYHVPFAGRMWGMTPESAYVLEEITQLYYSAFPKLIEWLQGFLWWSTGRLQATNLVGWGALALFSVWLHRRFALPLSGVVVSLLAIPLVQSHASSSYIDLVGNLSMTACLLLAWNYYQQPQDMRRRDWWLMAALICFSAFIKYLLLSLIGLVGALVGLRYVWLHRHAQKKLPRPAVLVACAGVLALSLYTPVRNTVVHGNPVYPLVFERKSEDKPDGAHIARHSHILISFGFERWLISVFELDRPVGKWTRDQLTFAPETNRKGGFNPAYVVAQLALLAWLCMHSPRDYRRKLLLFTGLLTVVAAWMPRPQELRYYMFWMVWLVSINLISLRQLQAPRRVVQLNYGYNAAMLVMAAVFTGGVYLWPQFIDRDKLFASIKEQLKYDFVPDKMDESLVEFA